MNQESASQEPAPMRPPATPATPAGPAGPQQAAPTGPGHPRDSALRGYAPAPPMRSAYPTAAEGGFRADPIEQPPPDAEPGPGYGDAAAAPARVPPADAAWMLLPVLAALVLGVGAVMALSQWAAVTTVAVGVATLAAAVLSWPASGTVRRSVLIAAAGPVGVLIGYWVIVFFRG